MKKFDRTETKNRKILDLEKIGFDDFYIAGFQKIKSVEDSKEMQTHTDMIEILYIDKGLQYYKLGQKELMLNGGDILIIPPEKRHGTNNHPEDTANLFWIAFKIPKNRNRLLNLPLIETKHLINTFLNLPSCHFKGNAKIATTFSKIFEYYDLNEKVNSKIHLTSLFLQLLLIVIDASHKNKMDNSPSQEISNIANYIKNNPRKELSISYLSDLINLSESRFKHRFKKEIGIPPGEFIMRNKINYAKENFSNYDSIQDLAFALEFSSSNYFASVFKKYTGSTPTEYCKDTLS
ncbi:AraC family transcriptional regulator [Sabulilitoribacter arenilitoris]|uniref:AraC family transcriptional regulator n=1 Tax=Wocania arenilitoris TaxID=2044858 RepID=A0AAE3ENN3_9FLAO|nr:AraC family transcriptional regulator [Wocania arenilitoris]MCF7568768.1 AraC family transcriptional regulator [Wocania arenilitoris]